MSENAKQFINAAIDKGIAQGLDSLTALEQEVFLISEAEVSCDMDGIDSFFDKYAPAHIALAARTFGNVGAVEIAKALMSLVKAHPRRPEEPMVRANELITDRFGYSFESLERHVEVTTGGNRGGTP